MTEYWVRLDVYLQSHTLDSAIEKAIDALSGMCTEVYVVEGADYAEEPNRVEVAS